MNNRPEKFEKALSGQYQLSVKSVFERANTLSKKSFGSMFQALLVLISASILVSMIFVQLYNIESIQDYEQLSPTQTSVMNIVITMLFAPLITGIVVMGIRNARNQQANLGNMFDYLSLTIMLALASLLTSILITLGIALLVLPGIYLYLTTKFTLPLIADRGLSPVQAVLMSIKILHRYVFHILLIMLVFLVLMVVVIMTLGLAFVWVGPLYFNVFGILYQDIVGAPEALDSLQSSGINDLHREDKETHFDA